MVDSKKLSRTGQQQQRLVLVAGPHKSASSSVQEFFMRYASDQKRKHPALVNWTWPYNPRRRSYLPRKGFAPLVTEYDDLGFRQLILDTIMLAWNSTKTRDKHLDAGGLIFGSEEFDRFGDTPWSHRNGMLPIQDILELLKPREFEILVNYRTPRHQHWISIWKQLVRTRPVPYRDFLCKDDVRTWEYLDAVSNPLGLVRAFRANSWKVTLIDMAGVANDQMDVAHVVACEVLKVPCQNGWVGGVVEQILQNTKTGDPEMTLQQIEGMEFLLRQRDCAYRDELEQDNGVQILHKFALWDGCDAPSSVSSLSSNSLAEYRNTTFLLKLLREQMGCVEGKQRKGRKKSIKAHDKDSPSQLSNVSLPASMVVPKGNKNMFEVNDNTNIDATTDHLLEVAKWQQRLFFGLVVAMMLFLVGRIRRKGAKRYSSSVGERMARKSAPK
jgi:hypothetical protein